ncbi:MAG TPA: 6-phosphogluconolactonase [Campylobacteraceae bacterium]|nr:6-phosphogluconolactonase [Campylobacteraceae bacterium]
MMSPDASFHRFETPDALAQSLSDAIAVDLSEAIAERGRATLLVSGGSTPLRLFRALRKKPIAWEYVRVGLCDERWVPESDPASNAAFVKRELLQEHAAAATFVGIYTEGVVPEEAEALCSRRLKEWLWPFDVIVLGMGTDAHTASLFPWNPRLQEALEKSDPELCIAMTPSDAPHPRMSLTLQAILSAGHIYLHFEGEEKLRVYEEALQGDDAFAMPIRAVLKQNEKKIEVYYA